MLFCYKIFLFGIILQHQAASFAVAVVAVVSSLKGAIKS